MDKKQAIQTEAETLLKKIINTFELSVEEDHDMYYVTIKTDDKTINSSKPTHVRGLSSYERKIMHEYITDEYPELTTYSIGEGRERHLVIDHKKDGETHSEFAEA
jgi:predicted RNA-binding protein Jag